LNQFSTAMCASVMKLIGYVIYAKWKIFFLIYIVTVIVLFY